MSALYTTPKVTPAATLSQSGFVYENFAYTLADGSNLCLQGLPLTQLRLIAEDNSFACGNFANLAWEVENKGVSGSPYSYSNVVQFEVPSTQECCLVYQSSDTRGCSNWYPALAEYSLTVNPRSCAVLGKEPMVSIAEGYQPATDEALGVCEGAGARHTCIDETNWVAPAVGQLSLPDQSPVSTGDGGPSSSGSGGPVQVTTSCFVDPNTGTISGSCGL